MIIDFHTHTFPEEIALRVVRSLGHAGNSRYHIGGSVNALAESMKKNGIDWSVNLPVMTRPDQVIHVNDGLLEQQEELRGKGIITFGGLHPDYEDYRTVIRKLKDHGIRGIKLHPAFQGGRFSDISYKRIVAAASEMDMIVLIHAGIDCGCHDYNAASVDDILEVVRDVRPTKLVLAHMGGWQDWERAEYDLAGEDVWFDTGYSLGAFYPEPGHEAECEYEANLSRESFVHMVRSFGADRVLFATDSPWGDQGEYVDFIRNSGLSEEEQQKIFCENAKKLLGDDLFIDNADHVK